MHPLLAAEMPASNAQAALFTAGVIVAIGGLAWLADLLWKLADRFKEKPIPSETYATKREMEEVRNRVTGLEKSLNEGFKAVAREIADQTEALNDKGEQRAILIHDRINAVLKAVSHIEGRIEK